MADECQICLTALETDLQASRCGHVFHSPCIFNWLEHKPICPRCKAPCKPGSLIKLFFEVDTAKPSGGAAADEDQCPDAELRGRLAEALQAVRKLEQDVVFQSATTVQARKQLVQVRGEGEAARREMREASDQVQQVRVDLVAKKRELFKRDKELQAAQQQAAVLQRRLESARLASAAVDYAQGADLQQLSASLGGRAEQVVATQQKAMEMRLREYQRTVEGKRVLQSELEQLRPLVEDLQADLRDTAKRCSKAEQRCAKAEERLKTSRAKRKREVAGGGGAVANAPQALPQRSGAAKKAAVEVCEDAAPDAAHNADEGRGSSSGSGGGGGLSFSERIIAQRGAVASSSSSSGDRPQQTVAFVKQPPLRSHSFCPSGVTYDAAQMTSASNGSFIKRGYDGTGAIRTQAAAMTSKVKAKPGGAGRSAASGGASKTARPKVAGAKAPGLTLLHMMNRDPSRK